MSRTSRRWTLWGSAVVILALIVWAIVVATGSSVKPKAVFVDVDLTVNAADPSERIRGAEFAGVTLIEYSDFQCPYCKTAAVVMDQLLTAYPNDVRLVFRNFPLRQKHLQAQLAAQAAEAAGAQDKYFEMHDILFERQVEWSGNIGARKAFVSYAEELGLDVEQFKADLDSKAVKDKVQNDYSSGMAAGVQGTPAFYMNGKQLVNLQGYESFVELVDAELERLKVIGEATVNAGGEDADGVGAEAPRNE